MLPPFPLLGGLLWSPLNGSRPTSAWSHLLEVVCKSQLIERPLKKQAPVEVPGVFIVSIFSANETNVFFELRV
jgi:uncharacterized membrane protein